MRFSLLLAVLHLAAAISTKRAPLLTKSDDVSIDGNYIVVLKSGAQVSDIESVLSSVASDANHVFPSIGGFAASLTEEEVESLRKDPNVSYIEEDSKVETAAIQEGAPWGLARLSNTQPGGTTYKYPDNAGEGVCAYVIDTGIDIEHQDFEGRATWVSTLNGDHEYDDHGHGTFCAGILAGSEYGVAKKANLYAIKSFDQNGRGNASTIIAGIEKAIEDAPTRDCSHGVVVSMSFISAKSTSIDTAAKALVTAGYFVAAAAGNGDVNGNPLDAATLSPASESTVCTVGATQSDDNVASFSNYGSVLDIYAPGVLITSDFPGGGTLTESGTSAATPHIAGLGASFLSQGMATSGLCEYLQSIALKGTISGTPNGTINYLAQNGLAS